MAAELVEDSSNISQDIIMKYDEEDDAGTSDEESSISSHEKRWYALNKSRGVTLSMLMSDGMIKPGKRVLSIDYLGRQFVADLLDNGKIKTHDNLYNTPSAWATHCKRIVNPDKKSGCGWASVKYGGKKLDTWKSIWCRKQRPHSPYSNNRSSPASVSGENGHGENGSRVSTPRGFDDSRSDSRFIDSPRSTSSPLTTYNGNNTAIKKPFFNLYCDEIQEEALNLSLHHESDENKNVITERKCFTFDKNGAKPSVKYESIGKRSLDIDPNTLVECEFFRSYGKLQPFTITITSNAVLLMDYHCHLTHSEVVGYLGGKWDSKSQHMSIRQIYPCRCRLGDKDKAPLIEEEIRRQMSHAGLSLVGWYHSHPHSQADPSLKDIGCQMSYQLKMKGSGSSYHPCLGFIVAPYDRKKIKDNSAVQAYWVMPPPENRPSDYGIPMLMKYSISQNESISEDLLSEMKKLIEFYKGSLDIVDYGEEWRDTKTYIHKIQASLSTRLPTDQSEKGSLMDFVKDLLLRSK
ncbi:MPN domain-containing protein [Patella vulgata]|uniref:MPN domain-containing protein n=1 Tax=Patella vulgata TaxID=6465 RepID=UPI00217F8713|nr:MPN domain-containing protein [Patella vulgata]